MLVWGFCLLVWCAVSLFLGGRHCIWTCWTAYWSMLSFDIPMREYARHYGSMLSFDTPQEETMQDAAQFVQLTQNTVLRPGESREGDGRKKTWPSDICRLKGRVSEKKEGGVPNRNLSRSRFHQTSFENLQTPGQVGSYGSVF